jgi:hypothetical protein
MEPSVAAREGSAMGRRCGSEQYSIVTKQYYDCKEKIARFQGSKR